MYRCYLSTIWLYLASVFLPFASSPIELYPLTEKEIRPIKALINKNQHCSDWMSCWKSYNFFFPKYIWKFLSRENISEHELIFPQVRSTVFPHHLPSLAFNSFSGSGTSPQCTSAVSWCRASSATWLYICLWIVLVNLSFDFNYLLYRLFFNHLQSQSFYFVF